MGDRDGSDAVKIKCPALKITKLVFLTEFARLLKPLWTKLPPDKKPSGTIAQQLLLLYCTYLRKGSKSFLEVDVTQLRGVSREL